MFIYSILPNTVNNASDSYSLLLFRVKQVGGAMGNLHGIYFDMTDESILNTLRVTAVSNNICISEDSVSCLQNGTYASNSFVADKIKDTDQTAGKSNVGNAGISNYSFTVRSTARALSLCDFSHIQLDYSEGYGDSSTMNNDDDSYRWLYMGLL